MDHFLCFFAIRDVMLWFARSSDGGIRSDSYELPHVCQLDAGSAMVGEEHVFFIGSVNGFACVFIIVFIYLFVSCYFILFTNYFNTLFIFSVSDGYILTW